MPSFFAAVDGLRCWGFLLAGMGYRVSGRSRPRRGGIDAAHARHVAHRKPGEGKPLRNHVSADGLTRDGEIHLRWLRSPDHPGTAPDTGRLQVPSDPGIRYPDPRKPGRMPTERVRLRYRDRISIRRAESV